MGRHKTYDRTELTDEAMHLFWEHGYHATSMRDVVDATGVNASSIYAEFDSKQALYEATLARYDEVVVTGHFGALEQASATLEEVEAVLRFFGEARTVQDATIGCLLCNAATELAPTADLSRASMDDYSTRLVAAFRNALDNARAAGRLDPAAPTEELSRFFTVLLMGMFVLLRAESDPALLQAAADQGLARLASVTR
jgi:TetR/AcrR family transcriptional repressor of nem operon